MKTYALSIFVVVFVIVSLIRCNKEKDSFLFEEERNDESVNSILDTANSSDNSNQNDSYLLHERRVSGNIAYQKPTSQSSSLNNLYISSKAVDGIKNTPNVPLNMIHTMAGEREYFDLDLESQYDISAIKIYNRQDYCSERLNGARVFGSSIPFSASHLGIELRTLNANYLQTIHLANQTFRYIRVINRPNVALHFEEIEVFGKLSMSNGANANERTLDGATYNPETFCNFITGGLCDSRNIIVPRVNSEQTNTTINIDISNGYIIDTLMIRNPPSLVHNSPDIDILNDLWGRRSNEITNFIRFERDEDDPNSMNIIINNANKSLYLFNPDELRYGINLRFKAVGSSGLRTINNAYTLILRGIINRIKRGGSYNHYRYFTSNDLRRPLEEIHHIQNTTRPITIRLSHRAGEDLRDRRNVIEAQMNDINANILGKFAEAYSNIINYELRDKVLDQTITSNDHFEQHGLREVQHIFTPRENSTIPREHTLLNVSFNAGQYREQDGGQVDEARMVGSNYNFNDDNSLGIHSIIVIQEAAPSLTLLGNSNVTLGGGSRQTARIRFSASNTRVGVISTPDWLDVSFSQEQFSDLAEGVITITTNTRNEQCQSRSALVTITGGNSRFILHVTQEAPSIRALYSNNSFTITGGRPETNISSVWFPYWDSYSELMGDLSLFSNAKHIRVEVEDPSWVHVTPSNISHTSNCRFRFGTSNNFSVSLSRNRGGGRNTRIFIHLTDENNETKRYIFRINQGACRYGCTPSPNRRRNSNYSNTTYSRFTRLPMEPL